jgi:hypothetical protein
MGREWELSFRLGFKFRETLELTMGNPEPNPGLREQTGVYKARKKG